MLAWVMNLDFAGGTGGAGAAQPYGIHRKRRHFYPVVTGLLTLAFLVVPYAG